MSNRHGHRHKNACFRLQPESMAQLQALAEHSGDNLTEVLRQAIDEKARWELGPLAPPCPPPAAPRGRPKLQTEAPQNGAP